MRRSNKQSLGAEQRLGETRLMHNGQRATVIAYRYASDIDIRFEDGTIREHIAYASFKSGHVKKKSSLRKSADQVRYKKPYIGETRVMENGMRATVTDYRSANDMDVQFEDGSFFPHVKYKKFAKGQIATMLGREINPEVKTRKNRFRDQRIGETRIMNNSLKATIIAYRSAADIDVQFENGTVREGMEYNSFTKGRISDIPAGKTKLRNNANRRIGERRVMNCGMEAVIIAYRNATDIDVQFKDGTVREHVAYNSFINGQVANKNSRIGETNIMSNGMTATVIRYRNAIDMDIQFEDGCIKESVRYVHFKSGKVAHAVNRIGETRVMYNGLEARIIVYRNSEDMDVRFSDGTIREHISYSHFTGGRVAKQKRHI